MEYFIIGLVVGALIMSMICKWSFDHEIKYKAETGIDMCLSGVFYTIRRNKERNDVEQ